MSWQAPGFRSTTEHNLNEPDRPARVWRPPSVVGTTAGPVQSDTEVFPVRFQPAGQEPEAVIWVSRRRGVTEPAPTLLTGYGVMGLAADIEPGYVADAFDAWRRAGGVVASAVLPGGGDLGERRGHARDGADGRLSQQDWLNAKDALVAAGVCAPDAATALGFSGPGNTLLNIARDSPGAFRVVAAVAPMVGFPQHDLEDLDRHPDRVPSDCSGLWKFGPGTDTIDANRRLESLGWQKGGGTHVVIAVGADDTRVAPKDNGLRYSGLLNAEGVPHTLIHTAEGGHQVNYAPPELLSGVFATAAARTGLSTPLPTAAPGLKAAVAALTPVADMARLGTPPQKSCLALANATPNVMTTRALGEPTSGMALDKGLSKGLGKGSGI
ncbi:alpha/beta hydrolase family protein [Streptodolium elevatio]|uniref:Prolyl oligopeptidase family serine peptidase n=1 Tax=Streptodolium elevatio TaxID=3157996 RepID=A0ABV3DN93_9ACTN